MKLVKLLLGIVVLYGTALVAIGLLGGSAIEGRVVDRVGKPLAATATIGGADLALIRGHLEVTDVAIRRDEGGQLSIDLGQVRCELPPLGIALIDDDCRELAISKMRVTVSAAGVVKSKSAHVGVHARRVVIDDAVLELSPSALVPGLGKIVITVQHAEAKDTLFKTPFSWIFSLDKLTAKLELPGDIVVTLGYADGKLALSGALFGARPLELPFAIPVAAIADDPAAEMAALARLAKDVAKQALADKAEGWIKSKLE